MDFDPKKNYYEILGVSEDANPDEIKKAFRKLAMQHHPDKKGGNKEKFQEVNEANQVIGNAQKKQQYDAYRKWGFGQGWFGGQGWFSGGDFWDFDIGDLMGWIFGGWFGGQGRARPSKWEDIKYSMTITFDEAYLGAKKKIKFERRIQWDDIQEEACPTCNGSGKVTQQAQTPFGVMQVQQACPSCKGAGKIFKKNGKEVPNEWLERKSETLDVTIPSSIKDSVYLKFSSKGNAGLLGGPAWDLYIQINIKSSDIYERKWDDLYVTTPMTIFDLVLGGEVMIKHPEWDMKVKIPKGTQLDDLVKVWNKWFGEGWVFKSKGSLYIIPKVHIPRKLSKDETKLREDLKKAST